MNGKSIRQASGPRLWRARGQMLSANEPAPDAGATLSFLMGFLESVPDVSAKLKAPVTADRKFEDVVKSAQDTAVLVY